MQAVSCPTYLQEFSDLQELLSQHLKGWAFTVPLGYRSVWVYHKKNIMYIRELLKKHGIELTIAAVFCVVSIVVGFFLSNFILTKLWGWFVVPIFAVPQISMVQSMGLTLLVGYVLRSSLMVDGRERLKKEFEDKGPYGILGVVFGYSILAPLFVWFVGYIITLFL